MKFSNGIQAFYQKTLIFLRKESFFQSHFAAKIQRLYKRTTSLSYINLSKDHNDDSSFLICQYCVTNDKSTTTRLRVVVDGLSKTFSGLFWRLQFKTVHDATHSCILNSSRCLRWRHRKCYCIYIMNTTLFWIFSAYFLWMMVIMYRAWILFKKLHKNISTISNII